jgi:hypothetical protein
MYNRLEVRLEGGFGRSQKRCFWELRVAIWDVIAMLLLCDCYVWYFMVTGHVFIHDRLLRSLPSPQTRAVRTTKRLTVAPVLCRYPLLCFDMVAEHVCGAECGRRLKDWHEARRERWDWLPARRLSATTAPQDSESLTPPSPGLSKENPASALGRTHSLAIRTAALAIPRRRNMCSEWRGALQESYGIVCVTVGACACC